MKDKKHKIKPQLLIIAGVAVVLLIVAVVAGSIISTKKKDKENTVGMTLTQKNLRPQDSTVYGSKEDKEKTTIEILMDDTAIPVGTTFMAAAIVEPADTEKALIWTSSNQEVMTVEQNGLVTIKGVGTAVLTATVGDVSDAVAIEGIASVTAGSKNGYIVYTGNGSITKSPSSSNGTSGLEAGNSGHNVGNNQSNTAGTVAASGNTGSDSGSAGNGSDNNIGNSGSAGNDSGNNGGNSSSQNNTSGDASEGSDNTGSGSGNDEKNTGKTSNEIADSLDRHGFTQEYSNVYVYTEAGTYYGEIIIQPNVSIIYIKQRSSGFDTRIKGVLAELLPDSYNQVWNNYLSATSDRTFTVEGRKVRIVTASGGGHSQIVIYN